MMENPSTKVDNDVDAAITAVEALRKSRENLMRVCVCARVCLFVSQVVPA